MKFVSAVIRTLVGILFGAGAALVLSPALAAFTTTANPAASGIAALGVIVFCGVLGLFAPTIRRAFGRGFLVLGVCFLALPLAVLALSGRVASEAVSNAPAGDQGATAVGAGLAGALMTGGAAFIGAILGAIFLIIGLVLSLGGRREVVVVERRY